LNAFKTSDPRKKMKAFYWQAVPGAKIEGTIWGKLQNQDEKNKINLNGIEKHFKVIESKKDKKDKSKSKTAPSKPK